MGAESCTFTLTSFTNDITYTLLIHKNRCLHRNFSEALSNELFSWLHKHFYKNSGESLFPKYIQ